MAILSVAVRISEDLFKFSIHPEPASPTPSWWPTGIASSMSANVLCPPSARRPQSAPVGSIARAPCGRPRSRADEVVEQATAKISPKCPAAVKAGFAAYRATDPDDRAKALGLCSAPPPPEFGWDELEFYLVQYFATMAMFNYPPSASPLDRLHLARFWVSPVFSGFLGTRDVSHRGPKVRTLLGTCFLTVLVDGLPSAIAKFCLPQGLHMGARRRRRRRRRRRLWPPGVQEPACAPSTGQRDLLRPRRSGPRARSQQRRVQGVQGLGGVLRLVRLRAIHGVGLSGLHRGPSVPFRSRPICPDRPPPGCNAKNPPLNPHMSHDIPEHALSEG